MQKEKLITYLKEKIRNLKNYSGDRLANKLKRLEKIISAERLNGHINNEELEELMLIGYVAALKKRADELIEKKGRDYILQQTIANPNYFGERLIKSDSELGKIFEDIAESVKIMRGYEEKQNR